MNATKCWVQLMIDKVAPLSPQSIHLDELLKDVLPTTSEISINIALECFKTAVKELEDNALKIKTILVWPIGHSEKLIMEVPQLECGEEPPSLYLADREDDRYYELSEEYRIPISPLYLTQFNKNAQCFYRCFRTAEAIKGNWEYERCIYIEHYPEVYLVE
jgi:hypothetical protein